MSVFTDTNLPQIIEYATPPSLFCWSGADCNTPPPLPSMRPDDATSSTTVRYLYVKLLFFGAGAVHPTTKKVTFVTAMNIKTQQRNVPNWVGHLACFGAYFIFGFNLVACKNIANGNFISPMGFFSLRALGATALLWIVALFTPRQKVERRDMLKIFIASMLGLFMTQYFFLEAITATTPLDASILASMAPIMTMFIAAAYLKEPITVKKTVGVLTSLAGVLLLIFNSVSIGGGAEHTTAKGFIMMTLNCLSFALYLGLFKPLIAKYDTVTFMKWMFLFSAVVSLPFDAGELIRLDLSGVAPTLIWQLLYVIVFATFVAYLLIPIGQKVLRPTLVSMYSYVQPIIAAALSIYLGLDRLDWQKVVAAALVFAGVALVNRSKSAPATEQKSEDDKTEER